MSDHDERERQQLLRAILDNPRDNSYRLVYADWLDERSGGECTPRSQFIRCQVFDESNMSRWCSFCRCRNEDEGDDHAYWFYPSEWHDCDCPEDLKRSRHTLQQSLRLSDTVAGLPELAARNVALSDSARRSLVPILNGWCDEPIDMMHSIKTGYVLFDRATRPHDFEEWIYRLPFRWRWRGGFVSHVVMNETWASPARTEDYLGAKRQRIVTWLLYADAILACQPVQSVYLGCSLSSLIPHLHCRVVNNRNEGSGQIVLEIAIEVGSPQLALFMSQSAFAIPLAGRRLSVRMHIDEMQAANAGLGWTRPSHLWASVLFGGNLATPVSGMTTSEVRQLTPTIERMAQVKLWELLQATAPGVKFSVADS